MVHRYFRYASALALGLMVLQSCTKSKIDTGLYKDGINSDFFAPLVKTRLDMSDAVERSDFLRESNDGVVEVHFREYPVVEQEGSDFFDIPRNQDATSTSALVGAGPTSLSFGMATFGGAELSSIVLFEGNLRYEFDNSLPAGTEVQFEIVGATLNGNPAQFIFEVTATSHTATIPVDGMILSLGSNNNIGLGVQVLNAPGMNTNDQVAFTWQFRDLQIEEVGGFFGQRTISLPATNQRLDLGGLNDFEGVFTLNAFELSLLVDNPLGIEMELYPVLNAIKGNKVTQIDLPMIRMEAAPNPGESTYQEIVFNSQNSNILELLTILPEQLFIQGTAIINPENNSSTQNFATRFDSLKVGIDFALPLDFSLNEISLKQEITDFSFDFDSFDEIEYIGFRISSRNAFPLNSELKIVFCGQDASVRLDSIEIPILEAAQVDANGRNIGDVRYVFEALYDGDMIDAITASQMMEVEVFLSSTDGGSKPVKVYSDQFFETNIAVRAGVNIQLSGND